MINVQSLSTEVLHLSLSDHLLMPKTQSIIWIWTNSKAVCWKSILPDQWKGLYSPTAIGLVSCSSFFIFYLLDIQMLMVNVFVYYLSLGIRGMVKRARKTSGAIWRSVYFSFFSNFIDSIITLVLIAFRRSRTVNSEWRRRWRKCRGEQKRRRRYGGVMFNYGCRTLRIGLVRV